MSEEIDGTQRATEYLLGRLPDAEAERLDELSVSDNAFARTLRIAEQELVDAYVHAELNAEDRTRFETHYLVSARARDTVHFARALHAFAARRVVTPPARESAVTPLRLRRWVAVAALLALVAAGAWLGVENARLRQRVADIEAQQRQAVGNVESELARSREQAERLEKALDAITIASVVLTPPLRTAAEIPVVRLSAGTTHVAVRLELEPVDYPAYRVALIESSTLREVWSTDIRSVTTTARGKAIDVSVRTDLVQSGGYTLRVSGVPRRGSSEVLGDYPFVVSRE